MKTTEHHAMKKRKTASGGKQSSPAKIQPGTLLFLSERCKRRPKTKDEFYMETDFSKKTITIGKGRNKITLNEMQVVLLEKMLSHQTRLLFGK